MATPDLQSTLNDAAVWEAPVLQLVGSRITLADRVYSQIRHALMSGHFMPGQTLTIDHFSDLFKVSHMPVREALRRLIAVEALEVAQNGSARVPNISIDRLDDICASRLLVEGHAITLAASNIETNVVAKLLLVAKTHEQCRKSNEVYRMLELNQQLHFEIYRQANSPILTQIIENLWLRHGPYMRVLTAELKNRTGPKSPITVGPGHDIFLRALRKGDADAAVAGLKTDILGPYEQLRVLCRDYNETHPPKRG